MSRTIKAPGERVADLSAKHVYTKLAVDQKTGKLKTSYVVLNGAINEWSKETPAPIYYVPALRVAGTEELIRFFFKDAGLDNHMDLFLENAYTKDNFQAQQIQQYIIWNAPPAGSNVWTIEINSEGTFADNFQAEIENHKEWKKTQDAITKANAVNKIGLRHLPHIMKLVGLPSSVTGDEDANSQPGSPTGEDSFVVPMSAVKIGSKKDLLATQFDKATKEGLFFDVTDVKPNGSGSHKVSAEKMNVKSKNDNKVRVFLGRPGDSEGLDKVFFTYDASTIQQNFEAATSGVKTFLKWAGRTDEQAVKEIVAAIEAPAQPVQQVQLQTVRATSPAQRAVSPSTSGTSTLFTSRPSIKTTGLGTKLALGKGLGLKR